MKHKIAKILSMLFVLMLVISITNNVLAQEDLLSEDTTQSQIESEAVSETEFEPEVAETQPVESESTGEDELSVDGQQPSSHNSISGMLWLDLNEDGVRDAGETAIADYPVYLYKSNNTSDAVNSTYTDEYGNYAFGNIEPGTYVLAINSGELGIDKYLLPLNGIENDNKFAINTDTWLDAHTDSIEIVADSVVTDINAGMRNVPGFDPISTTVTDENSLRAAIASAASGDVITLQNDITLTTGPLIIPAGKSISLDGGKKLTGAEDETVIEVLGNLTIVDIIVTDKSDYFGTVIHVDGGGSISVKGGEVSSKSYQGYAILVDDGDVTISGGKIAIYEDRGLAVEVNYGNVTMTGGEVVVYGFGCYGISVNFAGTIRITGGQVKDLGIGEFIGIFMGGTGIAAYLAGTCDGGFDTFDNTIIVEVASLEIPASYGGTKIRKPHLYR